VRTVIGLASIGLMSNDKEAGGSIVTNFVQFLASYVSLWAGLTVVDGFILI
jgi:hypothetical protein